MKKNLLTLILFFALLPLAKAQESATWCPQGAVWHYTFYDYATYSPPQCFSLYYSGDEIIGGKLCKRISEKSCETDAVPKSPTRYENDKYTYEEDGVIYYFEPETQTFDTLYNFNADIGDQWNVTYWGITTNVVVLEVSTVEINGFSLRQLRLRYSCEWNEFENEIVVCERIGNIQGHLFAFLGNCIEDGEETTSSLRCYQDDEFPLYETGIVPYCDYQHVSINETEPYSQLSVFPNPTNGKEVTISFPEQISGETEITVSDMLGKIVKTVVLGQNGGTISVAGLPAGVYLLSAKNGENVFKREKLIVCE